LCAVPLLGFFGHGVWVMLDIDTALKGGPGFLGRADWPMWKEIMVAYGIAPIVLAIPLLLFGRLRCSAAPPDSHAGSLALGAAFFTLLGVVAIALVIGDAYFDLGRRLQLPPEVVPIARILAIPSMALAEVLTLLFLGQIGWPLFRPYLQRAVATYFVFIILAPAAVMIADKFYPVLDLAREAIEQREIPFVGKDEETSRRIIIWSVILLILSVMVFLRYAGIAQSARRAIRKFLAGEA
jgi:hypothetical protein